MTAGEAEPLDLVSDEARMRDAALDAVLALHKRITDYYGNAPDVAVCEHCTSGGDPFVTPEGSAEWPCATVAAITAVWRR